MKRNNDEAIHRRIYTSPAFNELTEIWTWLNIHSTSVVATAYIPSNWTQYGIKGDFTITAVIRTGGYIRRQNGPILHETFKCIFIEHFESNFHEVYSSGFNSKQISIGSINSLRPKGGKPLPEPMMTKFSDADMRP